MHDFIMELLGVSPTTALVYLICTIMGITLNWVKQCTTNDVGLLDYWRKNPKRSQIALLGTLTTFILTIIADPESGKFTYIAIGYACDNFLNNTPATGKAAEIISVQEAKMQVAQEKIKQLSEQAGDAPTPPSTPA